MALFWSFAPIMLDASQRKGLMPWLSDGGDSDKIVEYKQKWFTVNLSSVHERALTMKTPYDAHSISESFWVALSNKAPFDPYSRLQKPTFMGYSKRVLF